MSSVSIEIKPFFSYHDELIIDNNVIMKGNRAIIPASLHETYLQELHKGHPGMESTKRRARDSVFWLIINSDIENKVKSCSIYNSLKPHQQKQPLKLHQTPDLPWSITATDIFEWDNCHYLVLVDLYSGWFEIDKLENLTFASVINKLKHHFSVHGIPQKLYSDNGTQFTSQTFREFATHWEFVHVTSSPEFPQSNGLSEIAVRSAKRLLETSKRDGTDL